MEKICSNEEAGIEFKVFWKNILTENERAVYLSKIRGYFNLGNRANKIINFLEKR